MITCNILYEDESEREQVLIIRRALTEIYRKQFFFNSRTYMFKPVKFIRKVKKE